MAEIKFTPEAIAKCRENLNDLITLIQRLVPLCNDFEELVGLCQFALDNDAGCKLVLKAVQEQSKK